MIETAEADVTFSIVDPLIPPRIAVIGVVPAASEVASALEPTVATEVLPEVQVTDVVRS